ncbi:MAG: hypothetical protein LBU04_07490 [Christensenellaceae bacterium]|nr:hypothetical protein [Christensenellaceae bacterium]
MPRIKIVEYDACDLVRKELYDEQIKLHGRITNMKKTLLNSPLSFKVLMEWYPLRDALIEFIDAFSVNVYAYAISSENDCMICTTFFRRILIDNGYNPDDLVLSEKDKLLWEYGRMLVSSAHNIPDSIFSKLKESFSEEQIVLLTAFGAMMIATNLINNALDVPLDHYLIDYAKK